MRIGPLDLPQPFCQAGLAGYSDRAMRLVARRRGCPYAVTEALLDTILLAGGHGLRKSIDINDEDHPVAGQIIGSEPQTMAAAAAILHQHDYDVLDLNFACPVKKIKNRARGGHMLRDVPRALAVLRAVRQAVPESRPLTLSLRRGFDDSPESAEAFYHIADEAWRLGFAALRVHARSVEQKYAGRADWSVLGDIVRRYPGRTILGSGDVLCAQDIPRMLAQTGVSGVWIARGAIGNPWIFSHAAALLADPTAELEPPTLAQQRQALEEHFTIAMAIHGEQLAGRRMRKQGIKYARWHPRAADVRRAFIDVASLRQWRQVLDSFYATDGPGVWPDPQAADEVNEGCEVEPGAQ